MNKSWENHFDFPENTIENRWLTRTDSLTQALEEATQQKVVIKVMYDDWGQALFYEKIKLGLSIHSLFLIREVQLWVNKFLFLIARSVIPKSTVEGTHFQLAQLGTQSLGHFLFNYPGMQREALEFTQQVKIFKEYRCLSNYQDCFPQLIARRSVFKLQQHPLLLTEFFMPFFKEILDVI